MAALNDVKYRFKRSDAQQEKMSQLSASGLKIFGDYSSIMMISAVIGFNKGKEYCIPIEKVASDRVQISFFGQKDKDVIDLIAYAHAGEQRILHSAEKYEIFENYANGGFDILYNALIGDGNYALEDRAELLLKYYNLINGNEFKQEI